MESVLIEILKYLAGGGVIGLVALWVNRRKTAAETKKVEAEGIKTDAETAGAYIGHNQILLTDIREMLGDLKGVHAELRECQKAASARDIKLGEQAAEIEHQGRTIKMLRDEIVQKEDKISELYGRLNP